MSEQHTKKVIHILRDAAQRLEDGQPIALAVAGAVPIDEKNNTYYQFTTFQNVGLAHSSALGGMLLMLMKQVEERIALDMKQKPTVQ